MVMRSVKEIVGTMNKAHVNLIKQELNKDEGYNKYTLTIIDTYQKGEDEQAVLEKLNISFKSLRMFERTISNTIFNFYGIEAKKVQDLLISSIFYAINGQNSKENTERSKELEELFHSMKQFGIEQIAAPLLSELHQVNINTPLETVYKHLSSKYHTILKLNNQILEAFANLNSQLADYLKTKDKSMIKKMISSFKKIRSLYCSNENKTSRVVYQLSKLICISYADQKQLLKDNKMGLGELITSTNTLIDALPFGIDRFYLKNVFNHVYAKHLCNVEKSEIARFLLKKETECSLFEASNFQFPNEISRNHVLNFDLPKTNEEKHAKGVIESNPFKNFHNHSTTFPNGGIFSTILN